MENQALTSTARKSSTLMCNLPLGRCLYCSSSAMRTDQPRAAKLSEDARHLKLKATLKPTKILYDASVKDAM